MEWLPEHVGSWLVEQMRDELNRLSAAAQLLAPAVRQSGEKPYDQYLAIVNQGIYRLIRTANQLETIQLPEEELRGRTQLLDLAQLCLETARQVSFFAEQLGVSFTYRAGQEWLPTQGDGTRLQRMLLELISNALHWAGEGGEAGMSLEAKNGCAVISVWDNGPGLQLAENGSESPDGLPWPEGGPGLGLAAARRIAAASGGTIVLEQREKGGVRAVVSLPLQEDSPQLKVRTPQAGYDANGGFSPALVELSSVLPFRAFAAENLE